MEPTLLRAMNCGFAVVLVSVADVDADDWVFDVLMEVGAIVCGTVCLFNSR